MTNKIALFSTAVLLSASLVACGSQGSTSQSASVEAQSKSEVTQNASTQSAENSSNSSASAASADDSGRVIGETSGEAAKATISNGLESDITSICMRALGGDSWGKNLLKQGEKIKKGDKATLGFKKSDENKEHDFLVKTADGNEVEFSAILLEAGASLTLESVMTAWDLLQLLALRRELPPNHQRKKTPCRRTSRKGNPMPWCTPILRMQAKNRRILWTLRPKP